MGQTTSRSEMNVAITLPEVSCKVDAIRLSYSKTACFGSRMCQIAWFTFPQDGWLCAEGVQMCLAEGGLRVNLAALRKADCKTTVRVQCASRGKTVFTSSMPLARLLGNKAHLDFCLCGGDDADGPTFSTLLCNGWPCGDDGGALPNSHEEEGGEGDDVFELVKLMEVEVVMEERHRVGRLFPTPDPPAPYSVLGEEDFEVVSMREVEEAVEEGQFKVGVVLEEEQREACPAPPPDPTAPYPVSRKVGKWGTDKMSERRILEEG